MDSWFLSYLMFQLYLIVSYLFLTLSKFSFLHARVIVQSALNVLYIRYFTFIIINIIIIIIIIIVIIIIIITNNQ